MIRLDEEWRIDTDKWNVILYRELIGKKDGKPGKASESFHRTLGQALEKYYRIRWFGALHERDMTLEEAVRVAKELREEVMQLRASVDEVVYVDN